ncbi:MAG: phenylalanine 4-monooxygenase, partial [Olleya sp.]
SRTKVLEQLINRFPNDWLLPIELFELAKKGNENDLCNAILAHLETIKQNRPEVGHLIDNGVKIASQEIVV